MDPNLRLRLIQDTVHVVFPQRKVTVGDLTRYFTQKKKGKGCPQNEQFLSLVNLRWFIRILITDSMNEEISRSSDPDETRRVIRQENIHPHEDVICTSAALYVGVFNHSDILTILRALRAQKFGRKDMDWAGNPHESPLQVLIEEGLLPKMMATSEKIFQGSYDDSWTCYFGIKSENADLFSLITFYLLCDELGFCALKNLFLANKFFFPWQERIIDHELTMVNQLFPKRCLLAKWHQSA